MTTAGSQGNRQLFSVQFKTVDLTAAILRRAVASITVELRTIEHSVPCCCIITDAIAYPVRWKAITVAVLDFAIGAFNGDVTWSIYAAISCIEKTAGIGAIL